jgi:hypothetical protein
MAIFNSQHKLNIRSPELWRASSRRGPPRSSFFQSQWGSPGYHQEGLHHMSIEYVDIYIYIMYILDVYIIYIYIMYMYFIYILCIYIYISYIMYIYILYYVYIICILIYIICIYYIYHMWFGTFFPYIGNNDPNWLIFFRGVETINHYMIIYNMYGVYSDLLQWQDLTGNKWTLLGPLYMFIFGLSRHRYTCSWFPLAGWKKMALCLIEDATDNKLIVHQMVFPNMT